MNTQSKDDFLNLTITRDTKNIKLRARKLFSYVNKIPYLAAVSTIRQKYPKFDPKSPTHWYTLIEKCEAELVRLETPPLTLKEAMERVIHELGKKGIYYTKIDTFCGRIVHFSFNGCPLGRIGWSEFTQRFLVSFGFNGNDHTMKSLEYAVEVFLLNTQNVWNQVAQVHKQM